MKFVDYYRVLGVRKNATLAEIRTAYLRLAKVHHPDRGGNESMMHRINEAYETLKDPKSRTLYDEHYQTHRNPTEADTAFYTTAFTREQTKKESYRLHIKELKRYVALFLITLFAMLLLYTLTTSSFYFVFLIPLIYATIQGVIALYQIARLRITKTRRIRSIYISPRTQVWIFCLFCVAVVCVVVIGSLLFVSEAKRVVPANVETFINQPLFEEEIKKINGARTAYEVCTQEFTEVTNQLNRMNQQLDNALSANDEVSIEKLQNERERIVASFDQKRAECNELQSKYNEALKNYRGRSVAP